MSGPHQTSTPQAVAPGPGTADRRPVGCDRVWFEQQYHEFAGLVLAFLKSRVPAATAEDLSQQVWLKIWKVAATQFDGQNFRAWVLQIARNALVDSYRRKQSFVPLEETDAIAKPRDTDCGDELLQSRTAALNDCLGQISEELQVVIRARMTGEPYEAISERFSIPLGTAHSRFNKAKSQLQKCVAGRLS